AHLLMHDLGDELGREDMGVEEHGVEHQRAEQAPKLSDGLGRGRLRHDKPSLRDRSRGIPRLDSRWAYLANPSSAKGLWPVKCHSSIVGADGRARDDVGTWEG